MALTCAATSCTQPGKNRCAGCKEVAYCSKACQTSHWPTHKKTCAACKKYNCFLVHADAQASGPPVDNTADQLEPFHLQAYGTEYAEISELKRRLGWTSASEVGKFYDHQGSDTWYYFVYGQTRAQEEGKPGNEIADLVCGGPQFGDVAVIRSGPAGTDTPETFTKSALAKTLEFYKTHSSSAVFSEREKSRFGKNTGFDLSGVTSMDATNWDFGNRHA
ncbi:MAG: hypothetical protein LQ338_007295 [Usnochroma carphineum]|nr:MAG: hypothetical protein LQ338_007295 [Usnochroma carphineum]